MTLYPCQEYGTLIHVGNKFRPWSKCDGFTLCRCLSEASGPVRASVTAPPRVEQSADVEAWGMPSKHAARFCVTAAAWNELSKTKNPCLAVEMVT